MNPSPSIFEDESSFVAYLMHGEDDYARGYRTLMYACRGEWDGTPDLSTEAAAAAFAAVYEFDSHDALLKEAMRLADIVSEARGLIPGRPLDAWGAPGSLLHDDWVALDRDVLCTAVEQVIQS